MTGNQKFKNKRKANVKKNKTTTPETEEITSFCSNSSENTPRFEIVTGVKFIYKIEDKKNSDVK